VFHGDQADVRFFSFQEEPDVPFTEEDYRRRRPHPNFKEQIGLEKVVVKLGKTVSSQWKNSVVSCIAIPSQAHELIGP
jgi:adenylate kinase